MKATTLEIIDKTLARKKELAPLKDDVTSAAQMLVDCAKNGGKILLCGNGGSCADCEHIAGELMKEFYIRRPLPQDEKDFLSRAFGEKGGELAAALQGAVPAIDLAAHTGLNSAYANDASPEFTYAQGVYGYGKPGDVLVALSTSGNAKNVAAACMAARLKGMKSVALTGVKGGRLAELCDVTLSVPETETYLVQELHLPLYHLLCRCVENELFGG